MNAPALPRAGVRSFRQRDAAGAAPYLLGSHGRMADCRDRAPPATCASCGCRCDSAAAPRRCDHVSDARGGRGPGSWPVGCDSACTGAPTRRAADAATSAPAGLRLRSAPRQSCRQAVPALVPEVRLRQGLRDFGGGGHAGPAQPADAGSCPGHAGRAPPPSAGCVAASARYEPQGSCSRRRASRTEGSRRIGCGLRSGKTAAGGW